MVVAGLQVAAPRAASFRDDHWGFPRVRVAAKEKDDVLRTLLMSKSLSYAPKAILLQAYKKEATLELWAENNSGSYTLVKNYPICAASGILGPKRRYGDEQVPEGFYELDWFNSQSNFCLSLHMNYPNAADRMLKTLPNPGDDIFLYGNRVTIGCIPVTDDGIKEIYWLAVLARTSGQLHIPIEIFPARLTTGGLDRLAATHRGQSNLLSFWVNLKEGFDAFEKSHKPPIVRVHRGGRYVFNAQ